MSTAADGLISWGQRLRRLPQQALDAAGSVGAPIEHGVESGAQMLGIPLGQHQPAQNPYMAPVGDVQDAYDSFQHQAPPRRMMPKVTR